MAISFSSNTSIEKLLKQALEKENISYQEQYRIYEKGNNLYPKYVVDFLVSFQNKSLVVECDGFSYHSSDFDIDRGIKRDVWLKNHGYGEVKHFTTYQIKYEIGTVILIIKNYLGIENISHKKLLFNGKQIRKNYIVNIRDKNLHNVTLYYDTVQIKDKSVFAYKYYDSTLHVFSDIRYKQCINVPDKKGNDFALMLILSDLKKSVNLKVFCQSEWVTNYLNQTIAHEHIDDKILIKIKQTLKNHNYLFEYINCKRKSYYYKFPADERLIISELKSKVRQIIYTEIHDIEIIDYNTYNL